MAKTKAPLPSEPTVDQILAEVFPATGIIDPAKAIALAEQMSPPQGMGAEDWQAMLAAGMRAGFALARADSDGSAIPPEAENVLKLLVNQPATASGFKALRTKLRITQSEIAKHLGVERSLVAKWEAEVVTFPPKAMYALMQIMNTRITEPPRLTGNDILKLREFMGISRADFAAKIGTGSFNITYWEKLGDRLLPRDASAKISEHCAEQLKAALPPSSPALLQDRSP